MQPQLDLLARTTLDCGSGALRRFDTSALFLTGGQLPFTIIATAIGVVLGYALWVAAHKGIGDG